MSSTVQSAEDIELPAFPIARDGRCPFDPPAALRQLQTQAPITRVRLWDGSAPWLVTRYADQRRLLADPRVSADSELSGFPHGAANQSDSEAEGKTFVNMDGPEHARLRRMVVGSFSVKQMQALRPAVQRIVDGLIDDMLRGPQPVDLVEAFALPVTSMVICQLLGVPYADHGLFQDTTRLIFTRDIAPDVVQSAERTLTDYLDDLIGRKIADPQDDLLSRLASEQIADGALTRRELTSMAILLLSAGHETSVNMISLGVVALLEHPEQLAAVRDAEDPARAEGAVEELLRYLNVAQMGRRRVALADIDVAGHTIRAGEGIVLPSDIANRDPDAFADPDRLDLHRDARRHIAFGFGPHMCLGAPLARVELQVAYSTLFRRIPTLHLAVEVDELSFNHQGLIFGVRELPIAW